MAGTIPSFTMADRLAKARASAGISVQEMARKLGVSRNTITNYESGRTGPPHAVVMLYAQFCDVALWWLLDAESEHGSTVATDGYRPVRALIAA